MRIMTTYEPWQRGKDKRPDYYLDALAEVHGWSVADLESALRRETEECGGEVVEVREES